MTKTWSTNRWDDWNRVLRDKRSEVCCDIPMLFACHKPCWSIPSTVPLRWWIWSSDMARCERTWSTWLLFYLTGRLLRLASAPSWAWKHICISYVIHSKADSCHSMPLHLHVSPESLPRVPTWQNYLSVPKERWDWWLRSHWNCNLPYLPQSEWLIFQTSSPPRKLYWKSSRAGSHYLVSSCLMR